MQLYHNMMKSINFESIVHMDEFNLVRLKCCRIRPYKNKTTLSQRRYGSFTSDNETLVECI